MERGSTAVVIAAISGTADPVCFDNFFEIGPGGEPDPGTCLVALRLRMERECE